MPHKQKGTLYPRVTYLNMGDIKLEVPKNGWNRVEQSLLDVLFMMPHV